MVALLLSSRFYCLEFKVLLRTCGLTPTRNIQVHLNLVKFISSRRILNFLHFSRYIYAYIVHYVQCTLPVYWDYSVKKTSKLQKGTLKIQICCYYLKKVILHKWFSFLIDMFCYKMFYDLFFKLKELITSLKLLFCNPSVLFCNLITETTHVHISHHHNINLRIRW